MNYEKFKTEVEHKFLSFMPKEYQNMEIRISQTMKVNETLDSLTLFNKDESAKPFPTMYINHMYEDYMLTNDFEDCMRKATLAMTRAMEQAPIIDLSNLTFENRKENIVFQLVNYEQNKQMLAQAPHRKYLDLAIVYRLIVDADDSGTASILINDAFKKIFKATEEELFNEAVLNTKRIFEPTITDMVDVIGAGMGVPTEMLAMMPRRESWVITNKQKLNGAGSILYEEYLYELANDLDDDLYILPSSIHECILLPANGKDPYYLSEMVNEVNGSKVEPCERLSNEVYFYSRSTRKITMETNNNTKLA